MRFSAPDPPTLTGGVPLLASTSPTATPGQKTWPYAYRAMMIRYSGTAKDRESRGIRMAFLGLFGFPSINVDLVVAQIVDRQQGE
jgi:hypothetical protein